MFSTTVTKKIVKGLKKANRSACKGGLSPTFVAYKVNWSAPLEIRRHYLGQHGCRRQRSTIETSVGINKVVAEWCGLVQGLQMSAEKKAKGFSITSHPPEYWRTIETMDPTLLLTLETDLAKLRSEMHGKK